MILPATLSFAAAGAGCWDALVVGAGPAGALAARQLALGGARTLLVDRKAFPRWKVCGACVNNQALSILRNAGLGELTTGLGAIPVTEFRVQCAGTGVTLPLTSSVALSRATFDAALVQAAVVAGADFLPETAAHVEQSSPESRTVVLQQSGDSVEASARVVLAADGLGHGCLSRLNGLKSAAGASSRIGAGCVVEVFPDDYRPGTVFMAVGRNGYVGLVCVENGSLNIAAAFDPKFVRDKGGLGAAAESVLKEAVFPEIPELGMKEWQGTAGLTRRLHRPADNRLFVLGDAAGYVEPFTGEGIAWALAAGAAVARPALRGIADWKPGLEKEWTQAHRNLIRRRQKLCRFLSVGLRHPLLVRGAFRLLARIPVLAKPLLDRISAPANR